MVDDEQEPPQARPSSRRRFLGAATGAVITGTAGFAAGRLTAPTAPVVTAAGARRFAGKVVLVTGATSGIGRAAAEAFAAEGAAVGFCGRREERGHEVEQGIRAAGGEAMFVRTDVRDEDQVRAFADAVVARYRRLDVVFSNAGIHTIAPLHETTTAQWRDILDTNVGGAFFTLKHTVPHLRAAGGGTVLVTSSINAIAVRPGFAAYGASKHALIGLVQSAALDYGADGIRVNAILPGFTDTELVRRLSGTEALPDAAYRAGTALAARTRAPALGRIATAAEVAAFAVDLASDRYPFMTGAAQVIDGGATASLP